MDSFRKRLSFGCASLVFSAALLAGTLMAQQAPDNSKNNQGDASAGAMTADKSAQNTADRNMTMKIRKSIMHDKTLSTYAHNIKIVTQDGKVTLKGPVRSEDEKAAIQAKAVSIAGADNVSNELEIAPAS
ncbi:MAG: BON domain-containing protein [Candidatus Acidiferrales bacterium]